MKNVIRDFYDNLNTEENSLNEVVSSDPTGLIMRIAINELDLYAENSKRKKIINESDEEHVYLMRVGVARIIKLALQAHKKFTYPTVTMKRSLQYSGQVLNLIQRSGTIEHGRRVAQSLIEIGGKISKNTSAFEILLPTSIEDMEANEKHIESLYEEISSETFSEEYSKLIDGEARDEIKLKIMDLVYPFRDHFIGYDADPSLDLYFFGHGYHLLTRAKGYDTFHYSTKFGGVTFQNYKLAASFIISTALKHREFVEALTKKNPDVVEENILTVSVEADGFIKGLKEYINYFGKHFDGHVPITDRDAKLIFNVLSISRKNLELLDRPGAAYPLLVQCSNEHVIRPLFGVQKDEVMLFLLNSLQHSFKTDFDRAQQNREGVMQRAIERELKLHLDTLEVRRNIKIRKSGKTLTDIDLVLYDSSENYAVLVQLKHQDPYGADLAARSSKRDRLNKQVNDWAIKVKHWVEETPVDDFLNALRIKKSNKKPKVELLVVTRYYASSLRDYSIINDFAFCNWIQFFTAASHLHKDGHANGSLRSLIYDIKMLVLYNKTDYLPEPPSLWEVGKLKFTIRQEATVVSRIIPHIWY